MKISAKVFIYHKYLNLIHLNSSVKDQYQTLCRKENSRRNFKKNLQIKIKLNFQQKVNLVQEK